MPPALTLCLLWCRLLLLMALGHHTHTFTLLLPPLYLLLWWQLSVDTPHRISGHSLGFLVTLTLSQLGHVFIASDVGGGGRGQWWLYKMWWLHKVLQNGGTNVTDYMFWLQRLLHKKTITITKIQKVLITITMILKQTDSPWYDIPGSQNLFLS